MNHAPLVFLGVLASVVASWWTFAVAPQLQLGAREPVKLEETGQLYPSRRPGMAGQGAEVYRALGCNHCHSQAVRQSGAGFDLVLTAVDSNANAVVLLELIRRVAPSLNVASVDQLAKLTLPVLLKNESFENASRIKRGLDDAGAKSELVLVPSGADIARGWGKRLSVAQDYLYDLPVMLGSVRVGPDLANVGARAPEKFAAPWKLHNATNYVEEATRWHLLHLYQPRLTSPGSVMPAYRFLFEQRPVGRVPSPDALTLPAGLAAPAGHEIVPRHEAKALVAYLLSLQGAEVGLPNAPVSAPPKPPAPATNAPAAPSK
jgi:cbb3-type cytochrome oxidase cytochrome c subunit